MFNWAKQQLANVAGTQEPIYGPTAIQSVSKQAETTPYTELTREDLKWQTIDQTSVETQIFYLTADSGHFGLAQVIHSNVAGIRTTTQFNVKVFYPRSENKAPLWATDYVNEVDFSDDKTNFYGKDVAIELSADGAKYTIRSMVNQNAVVNLSFTRTTPGFVAGKDGKSVFGTDPKAPWGSVRHAFWPRNSVEGSIVTKDGPIDFKGKGLFIHALQGMKPHHAAAKWTFLNYQGPTYSAIMMQFTTPESYGRTVVTVGGVVKDGEIIIAGSPFAATPTKTKPDVDNDWQEPEEIKFEWTGKSKDGRTVNAVVEGALESRIDRIDIMEEVPGFVKSLVAAAAGTKPYIYQYLPATSPPLKLKIDDQEITEQGVLFSESTFIVA